LKKRVIKTKVARPVNKRQLAIVNALVKKPKSDFKKGRNIYNSEFLLKAAKAEEQIKAGRYPTITPIEIIASIQQVVNRS